MRKVNVSICIISFLVENDVATKSHGHCIANLYKYIYILKTEYCAHTCNKCVLDGICVCVCFQFQTLATFQLIHPNFHVVMFLSWHFKNTYIQGILHAMWTILLLSLVIIGRFDRAFLYMIVFCLFFSLNFLFCFIYFMLFEETTHHLNRKYSTQKSTNESKRNHSVSAQARVLSISRIFTIYKHI